MSKEYDDWLNETRPTNLQFPLTCETEDLDGNWILVSLTKWLGDSRWLAFDEDGKTLIVHSSHLRNIEM